MKNKLYILIATMIVLLAISGCSNPPLLPVPFDASKAGNAYETTITIDEYKLYAFRFEYITPRLKNGEYEYARKFVGDGVHGSSTQEPSMRTPGTQIILKLTVTPLQPLQKPMVYFMGNYSYSNYQTVAIGQPFTAVADLSVYPEHSFTYRKEQVYRYTGKWIACATLEPGKYKVRLENLKDVPEIQEIQTEFSVTRAGHGK